MKCMIGIYPKHVVYALIMNRKLMFKILNLRFQIFRILEEMFMLARYCTDGCEMEDDVWKQRGEAAKKSNSKSRSRRLV